VAELSVVRRVRGEADEAHPVRLFGEHSAVHDDPDPVDVRPGVRGEQQQRAHVLVGHRIAAERNTFPVGRLERIAVEGERAVDRGPDRAECEGVGGDVVRCEFDGEG